MSTTITITRKDGKVLFTENGITTELTTITKDGESYVLPENSLGRKYFSVKKLEKAETHELTAINRNPGAERTFSRKSLLEYMTPEDKILYDAIMDRCKKAREEATKKVPMTEAEKLRNRIAKLEAQLKEALKDEAEG